MDSNILSLKLHRQYKRCILSLTTKNSEFQLKGIALIDDFLQYLYTRHQSISDKVIGGVSDKKSRNKYEKRFDEFNFYLIINPDISCEIGVDIIKKANKSLNNTLLKSAYLKNGYVYILNSDYGFKIGCTKDINRRFKELKTLMPFELKLHSTIVSTDFRSLEKILHDALKDKRINGEWFELDNNDFKYIDELCKLHKTIRIEKYGRR